MDIEQLEQGEKIKIGSELSDKFSDYDADRKPHESIWQQCLAFLMSKQHIKWDEHDQKFTDITKYDTKFRLLTTNLLLSPFKTVVGKLNSIQPILNVLADESYDERNISGAKLSDIILKILWRDTLMRQKMMQKDIIRLTFGYSFLEPYFDPTKGKQLPDKDKKTGEACVDVLSPFDVWLPNVTANYQIRDCFIGRVRSVDYVRNKYHIEVKPQENLELSSSQNMLSLLLGEKTPKKIKNSVMLLEYFELPTDAYPSGRRVALVDKNPVAISPLPDEYKHNDDYFLPIRKFDFFTMPLTIYAQGIIEPAISPQREYNYTTSVIKEHIKKLKGKVWATSDLKTEINDVVGQLLKIDPTGTAGTPIGYLSPPPIPNHFFQDLARIRQDIQDVMNVHDVSMAKVPSGVKAGKAILALKQSDDEPLSPILQLDEEELAIVGDVLLNIAQNEYKEPRLISKIGLNLSYEARQFLSQTGKNEYTNEDIDCKRRVTVQLGSGLPFSKVARQEYIASLRQMGVRQLQDDDTFLRMLDLGQISEEFKNLDVLAQETENEEMARGIIAVVHEYDNHQVHLKVLDDFCKRPSFDGFPKDIQNIFITHRHFHQGSLQRQIENAKKQGLIPAEGGENARRT